VKLVGVKQCAGGGDEYTRNSIMHSLYPLPPPPPIKIKPESSRSKSTKTQHQPKAVSVKVGKGVGSYQGVCRERRLSKTRRTAKGMPAAQQGGDGLLEQAAHGGAGGQVVLQLFQAITEHVQQALAGCVKHLHGAQLQARLFMAQWQNLCCRCCVSISIIQYPVLLILLVNFAVNRC